LRNLRLPYGDFSYGDFSYGDFSRFRAKSREETDGKPDDPAGEPADHQQKAVGCSIVSTASFMLSPVVANLEVDNLARG
jgi:hypothetical protein